MRTNRETICMYTPAAGGGHARYTWEMMHALSAQAASPFAFELVSAGDLEAQFREATYPVHTILPLLRERREFSSPLFWAASRVAYYPRRERAFLRWLAGRPDIVGVHLQEWKPWLAAPMIRRLKAMGKKVYYTVHNVVPHRYPRLLPKWVMDGWIRRACRMCDGLFVLSEQLEGKLRAFLGNVHPPIRVTPHGVWTVRDLEQGPSMEERLAWKRLLFFGSIRENKGLHLLLAAAEGLAGYSLTIAGEPDDAEYMRVEILPRIQRLREAGMKVELIDRFVSDEEVGELFAKHSAIVLPYTKGFVAQSGVAFMALAYELPMVATEAGGLRDLLNEFKVGVTAADASPERLAAAVRALYDGGVKADLVGQIRAAKRRFSWEAAARETIAGYGAARESRREAHEYSAQPNPAH